MDAYIHIPWLPSPTTRNGFYDIEVTMKVTDAQGLIYTIVAPVISVDREDLLIPKDGNGNLETYPINPTPLLWNPYNVNPLTGIADPLTATVWFGAAYNAPVTTTLRIYHSYDNVNPVRTITQTVPMAAGGAVFQWDGTADPIPDSLGNLVAGPVQATGAYLFKFSLSDAVGATDCDKSDFLNVTAPTNPSCFVSNDGVKATYCVLYTLLSSDTPARPASSGELDAYDLLTMSKMTQPLVGDLNPGPETANVAFPVSFGPSIFLVSPLDADADRDKGGRSRYALQHNNPAPLGIEYFRAGSWDVLWAHHVKYVFDFTSKANSTVKKYINKPVPRLDQAPHVEGVINGAFFTAGKSIADIGYGTANNWVKDIGFDTEPRSTFGMTQEVGGDFQVRFMDQVQKLGKPVKEWRGTATIEQSYPEGLSSVGDLINAGAIDNPEASWPSYNIKRARTAIGSSATGDLFLVIDHYDYASGSKNVSDPRAASWNDTAAFLLNTLPAAVKIYDPTYTGPVQILDAVMLDGGGSPQLSYKLDQQPSVDVQRGPIVEANIVSIVGVIASDPMGY